MKTRGRLKEEFKKFFEKHPQIRKIPFLMTIVIPKYECKGERSLKECGELLEDEEFYKKYLDADYDDVEILWESFMKDLPEISEKDAFYLFSDNNLVVVSFINKEAVFEGIDFEREIWDMY